MQRIAATQVTVRTPALNENGRAHLSDPRVQTPKVLPVSARPDCPLTTLLLLSSERYEVLHSIIFSLKQKMMQFKTWLMAPLGLSRIKPLDAFWVPEFIDRCIGSLGEEMMILMPDGTEITRSSV